MPGCGKRSEAVIEELEGLRRRIQILPTRITVGSAVFDSESGNLHKPYVPDEVGKILALELEALN
jgi:hypothetical protein